MIQDNEIKTKTNKTMNTYKITKNGNEIVSGLKIEQAIVRILTTVEEFGNGFIFDPHENHVFSEVDKKIVGELGDESIKAGDDLFEIIEETFDIRFDSDEYSNNLGFKASLEYCENYISMHNGTNHSYFADYKGGTVSIVSNDTDGIIFETEVK